MPTQASLSNVQGVAKRPLLTRFLCTYLLFYMFPFPLTAILAIPLVLVAQVLSPFGIELSMLASLDQALYHLSEMLSGMFTVPLGKILGLEVHLNPTGSGDSTHHALKMALTLTLALFIALAWNWRKKGEYPTRKALWALVWGRWWLATCMMQYGFIKIFGQQFHVATSQELSVALGDYSPMHLAWAFLGHSPSYQCFAGLAELIPAILILNRKTAMLGLLMMLGVLTNVFALNLFFDIPVKLASGHYLLTTIVLLVPYWPRIRGFVKEETTIASVDLYIRPERLSERTWSRIALYAGIALVISGFLGTNLRARQMEKMRKPSALAGRWDIQSTHKDAAAVLDTTGFQTLAIDNMGRLSLFDFAGNKTTFGLDSNPSESTLTLRYPFRRQKDIEPSLEHWTFQMEKTTAQGPNHHPTGMQDRLSKVTVQADKITLQGQWKGHRYEIVAIRRPLPIKQGFRWIQEAPFQI